MVAKISLSARSPIVNTDDVCLSDYSKKDAKWDMHRGNTQSISDLYSERAKYSKLANRMGVCSTFLALGRSDPDDCGETKLKLKEAKFCKVRHCPVCQWRRAMRNTRKVFERLPALEAEHPNLRWLFLTLTIKNPTMDNLRSTIVSMNAAWKRMIQRKDWPALGWLRAVEVTLGQDGNPHPHFHVLMCVKPSYFSGTGYIKQETWLQMWRDCMRDQSIMEVDIRVVKPKNKGGNLGAAVVETLKYSFKPEDVMRDPEFLYGLTDQLHKMRFLACGGSLKGLLKENVSNKEMIVGDETTEEVDQAKPLLVFKWRKTDRRYVMKR